ncbi:hypothetical protein [Streptomyces hydrogenans]
MSLENAPAFMGLRVPHVARWTGEVDITPAVVDEGDRLRYTSPIVDATCRWKGALWQRWVQAQGKGEPVFDSLHSTRQRVAIWEQRCQVWNEPTRAESRLKGGTLYLIGSNREAGSSGPIMEGEPTENAPLHIACAWESAGSCRHLLKGYAAARVSRARPWGVEGLLHAPVGVGCAVAFVRKAKVEYSSPQARWMVASKALMELKGVHGVDLVAEADQAGLLGTGSGR